MKNRLLLLSSSILLLLCFSCKQSEQQKKVASILTEWVDRVVVLPDTVYIPKEGIVKKADYECCDYKILNYVDSIGCLSCELKLTEWNALYKRLQDKGMSVMPVFIFGFSNNKKFKKEIYSLLRHNAIAFPVVMDSLSQINKLNNFPDDRRFQTFLLDKENKVVVIGNPIYNPYIEDLYFDIATNKTISHRN